jgi:hypothetical protein
MNTNIDYLQQEIYNKQIYIRMCNQYIGCFNDANDRKSADEWKLNRKNAQDELVHIRQELQREQKAMR